MSRVRERGTGRACPTEKPAMRRPGVRQNVCSGEIVSDHCGECGMPRERVEVSAEVGAGTRQDKGFGFCPEGEGEPVKGLCCYVGCWELLTCSRWRSQRA